MSIWQDLPTGPFDLASIDFPWRWKTRTPAGDGKAPPYPRLDLAALKTFPLRELMAPNSGVAMWVIDSHVFQAKELCDALGLRFSTVVFYWAKRNLSGLFPMGTGKTTRANPEQCWLLWYGEGLPIVMHDVRRLVIAPPGRHSRKPDGVRLGLERLFGDVRRVELFARERHPGWTPWGNELS